LVLREYSHTLGTERVIGKCWPFSVYLPFRWRARNSSEAGSGLQKDFWEAGSRNTIYLFERQPWCGQPTNRGNNRVVSFSCSLKPAFLL